MHKLMRRIAGEGRATQKGEKKERVERRRVGTRWIFPNDKLGRFDHTNVRSRKMTSVLTFLIVPLQANQPAEAPETRCASEPPAVQAAVDVPEVAAVEAAVPSQPAAEDVQAEAQHAEAQHTYAAGVQESSKEDGAEPQSAAPTAGLQALEHEVVPQQHDGLNGAVKESDSAAAEAASAEQSHAGQPPSSAPQAASLPVQEPVVDQKEPPRAFGSAPSKDEEAAVKAGEVGGSLEGDDTAREAPADSVVLQRESVPADASAAGEREENEVQVPAEANHATPMDHDADQEVDVKPSQQAEDAGMQLEGTLAA